MKYIFILGILYITLAGSTCRPQTGSFPLLYDKTWLHAHEEDQADILVYRPNTYQFPPSRGRTGFTLEKDGTYRLLAIAPTDGLEEHQGTWKALKENKLQVSFPNKTQEDFIMELVTMESDLLKVRRLPAIK